MLFNYYGGRRSGRTFWRAHALRAETLCIEWHTGTDRNGRPAYEHPLAVAQRVLEDTGNWAAYCAACLHDTIEDTEMPVSELEQFPADVIDAVMALTRGKDESANTYFRRVMRHMLAQRIKVHDVEHNFSPGRADEKILRKASLYAAWHRKLCNALSLRRSFCEVNPALHSACECYRCRPGRRLRCGARDSGLPGVAGESVAAGVLRS